MKAGINEDLNSNHCYDQLVNYYPCSLQNESVISNLAENY